MKITLTLSTDERIALRKLSHETRKSLKDTAHMALREYLIVAGMLELEHDLGEDTETQGEA